MTYRFRSSFYETSLVRRLERELEIFGWSFFQILFYSRVEVMSTWLSVVWSVVYAIIWRLVVCECTPMQGFLWCLSLMVFVSSQARVFIYVLMIWARRSGSLSFTPSEFLLNEYEFRGRSFFYAIEYQGRVWNWFSMFFFYCYFFKLAYLDISSSLRANVRIIIINIKVG